jgi:hypothetical protein
LVDRHGRRATISFTLPDEQVRSLDLRNVGGVRDVAVSGNRVAVHGDRSSIAYVGAALVRAGTVPDDLTVDVPDLEDALIGLLEQVSPEVIGVCR